jgi:hypothetical protein
MTTTPQEPGGDPETEPDLTPETDPIEPDAPTRPEPDEGGPIPPG